MGYSVASGEIKQLGATATADGITEASSLEIGNQTLHDVSYNQQLANSIKAGERIALLLTPTRYVAAARRSNGEIVYASAESKAHLEKPMSYPFYAMMGVLGVVTTFAGVGLLILVWLIRSYMARREIVQAMGELRGAAL